MIFLVTYEHESTFVTIYFWTLDQYNTKYTKVLPITAQRKWGNDNFGVSIYAVITVTDAYLLSLYNNRLVVNFARLLVKRYT